MANIKSSLKDIRRIKRRTARNVIVSSRIKTLRKKALTASADALPAAIGALSSALDKAVKSGVVHPNKVNRTKSRLAKFAAKAKAAAAAPAPAAQ
jgi:small subunit ribosomal protein S20